jgi:hypothetical protein
MGEEETRRRPLSPALSPLVLRGERESIAAFACHLRSHPSPQSRTAAAGSTAARISGAICDATSVVCIVESLKRWHGFIEALIQSGGDHQTSLYSILWSPYMAGRVIKDKTGAVKAICVINAP